MKTIAIPPKANVADEVLREVWRIKDELSASYNHDLERLFADAQKRQQQSGRTAFDLHKAKAGSAVEVSHS